MTSDAGTHDLNSREVAENRGVPNDIFFTFYFFTFSTSHKDLPVLRSKSASKESESGERDAMDALKIK